MATKRASYGFWLSLIIMAFFVHDKKRKILLRVVSKVHHRQKLDHSRLDFYLKICIESTRLHINIYISCIILLITMFIILYTTWFNIESKLALFSSEIEHYNVWFRLRGPTFGRKGEYWRI